MKFDGVDLRHYFRINYEKPLTQNATVDAVTLPGRPGQMFRRVQLQPKTIKVLLRLKNRSTDDMGAFRRFYSALLFKNEPKKAVFYDDPDVYCEGLFQGDNTLDNLWYTGSSEVQFFVPVPLSYGLDPKEIISEGTSLTGTYLGTYESWPTFEARPQSGSSFKLTNNATGEFIEVDATFNGNQLLVIDCNRQQTTINGVNYPVTFESDYFAIGAYNSPFPTDFDLTSSHADVKMTWREVYA